MTQRPHKKERLIHSLTLLNQLKLANQSGIILFTLNGKPQRAKTLIDATGLTPRLFFKNARALIDSGLIYKSGTHKCMYYFLSVEGKRLITQLSQ